MASKRRIRRKRCESKRAYATREQAISVIATMRRLSDRLVGDEWLTAYRCGSHWHVGHQPGFVRRKIEDRNRKG